VPERRSLSAHRAALPQQRTSGYIELTLFKRLAARAALMTPARVECAATGATAVHRPREPVGDERAQDEDAD